MKVKVKVYPVCSKCEVAYVLRRAFVFSLKGKPSAPQWVWQRDCKCRNAPAVARAEVP